MLGAGPQPPSGVHSYLQYWLSLLVFSPFFFILLGTGISVVTWEWGDYSKARGEMVRQAWMTAKGLMVTSPILAVMMKAILEQRVGQLRYDQESQPLLYHVACAFGFLLVQDFVFYCTHRSWHSPWLYRVSHSFHHSCRPTTTYAASAADAAEIILTGYVSALAPAILIPMDARLFLAMDLFGHVWSIYLHNHDAHRWGFGLYDPHDHNIHHYYGQSNYNFGLYFQLWDRLLGTYKASVASGRLAGKPRTRPLLPAVRYLKTAIGLGEAAKPGQDDGPSTMELLHEGTKEE